ncbi:MAG TPA: protein kinase [Gemmataceae bacterium]|nr:protein kinase [Gemmataceae bacterium]
MADKQHPNHDLLAAFLAGTLPDAAHEGVAAHIAECDACCAQLRQVPDDPFVARLRGSECGDTVGASSGDDTLPRELREHPKYKIGRYLGAGGMGLVYQAEHRLMDRVVALKIIHRDLSRLPRVVQRFRQEVRAAGKLSHPNIVAAYDAEQAGDAHFLVMEFVDGMSLDRLISKRGQLEPAYAAYFIRQAAKGLQHAFEKGMVHRDIKPQNLMLNRKGQIKILDFGLARLASETRLDLKPLADADNPELTKLGEIMGTPDYMAPEQATDSSRADIRADIYSLGCTLYYLLAGQPPFAGETSRDKVYAQKFEEPTPIVTRRSDVSAELAAVLEKMMAKNPDARYQTPAEVVKALAPFAKPTPVSAPVPEPKKTPVPATAPAAPEMAAPRPDAGTFFARCPFCLARIRIPVRGLGASLPCPHCNSFFTAVPEDETPPRG